MRHAPVQMCIRDSACVAFYAIPLGVGANQAGLFASPVMEEFGWSRTDATLYMSIQPWVAAICTPFAGKPVSYTHLPVRTLNQVQTVSRQGCFQAVLVGTRSGRLRE